MSAIGDAIQQIEDYIVENGNEEITADVLRPLLVDLGNAVKGVTGDPANLNTLALNLVQAINEVRSIALNAQGHKTFTGTVDPNVTPPVGYSLGDYYARYTGSTLIGYFQFNGYNWIEIV